MEVVKQPTYYFDQQEMLSNKSLLREEVTIRIPKWPKCDSLEVILLNSSLELIFHPVVIYIYTYIHTYHVYIPYIYISIYIYRGIYE